MQSMTGFGRGEEQDGDWTVSVELSGVNRKQSEIVINLPRAFNQYETELRQMIAASISRGRVAVSVGISAQSAVEYVGDVLNEALVVQQSHIFQRIREISGQAVPETIADYMRLSDILKKDSLENTDAATCLAPLKKALQTALSDFLVMRGQEGRILKEDILSRIEKLEAMRISIEEYAPQVLLRYRDQLIKRLEELGIVELDLGDERVLKELAIFAERCDIAEECTRLAAHFTQFRLKAESGEAVGRPLDFLCQEINREFNTIASKANDAVLAHCVVEAKTELEKIREQVQNIE